MLAGMTPKQPDRGPRTRLNRDTVVDAALGLVARDGASALSMRRLGSELGVEAMSLYNHVGGRDELLDAIGDRLFAPLGRVDLGGPWRDGCRRFARRLRAIALQEPAAFSLVGLKPLDSTRQLRAVERLLQRLRERGFAVGQALAVYRATVSFARGYALGEAAGFTVDAVAAERREALRALPADDFPVLAESTDQLARLSADAGFEFGLNALLDGVPDPG